jgi:DNA-binding MarR family transcriptional regulator
MPPESARRFVVDQRGGNVALDLFVVDQHLGSLVDATLAEAGLTGSLYAVYSQLAQGPHTPGQLSETLGVRPTTLSGYLVTMAGWGHASRTRNELDGRSSVLALTEAGHAKVRECRPLMQRAVKALNAGIGSADDVRAARALIAKVDAAIEEAHRRLRVEAKPLTSTTNS